MYKEDYEPSTGGIYKLWNMIKGASEEEGYPINPPPFYPPRFDYDDPSLSSFFDANGYVVIKSVANEEQIQTARNLFWDLVESQMPLIKRNDPSSWSRWVADGATGIMSGFGIGQSQFLWYTRLLPKVKEAFSQIWKTDDLLVSYDGCGVFRPPEFNPIWRTRGGWFHIDQNCYKKPGRHAVQGLVNYYPSGPRDGGFVVVPKSHIMMEEAFSKLDNVCNKNSGNYVPMRSERSFWIEARNAIKRDETNRYDLLPVKVCLEAGDMVLWDSRSIHCNTPVTKDNPDPIAKTQLKRLAAYVCMTPSSLASNLEQLVKYRIYAFQNGITTTHWPHEFYPSWLSNYKLPGVGSSSVKLTPEQATLITGKSLLWNVYDEKLVAGVNLNNLS